MASKTPKNFRRGLRPLALPLGGLECPPDPQLCFLARNARRTSFKQRALCLLEEASTALFQWFDNKLLENSPDKRHLLINSNENITVKADEYEIENS